MEEKTIRQRVAEVVAGQFGLRPSEIEDKTSFDELGADSLDKSELIMELEEEFNETTKEGEFALNISDDDAEKVKTVQDAVFCVEKFRKKIA